MAKICPEGFNLFLDSCTNREGSPLILLAAIFSQLLIVQNVIASAAAVCTSDLCEFSAKKLHYFVG